MVWVNCIYPLRFSFLFSVCVAWDIPLLELLFFICSFPFHRAYFLSRLGYILVEGDNCSVSVVFCSVLFYVPVYSIVHGIGVLLLFLLWSERVVDVLYLRGS